MLLRVYTGASAWWNELRARAETEVGATAVEYALMLALIAMVIIAAVTYLGHATSSKFSQMGSGLNNA